MKRQRPKGSISSHYMLPSPDPALVKLLQNKLTWRNPEYDNVTRYSQYQYTSIPETVCLADYSDDVLKIPRGMFHSRFLGKELFKRLAAYRWKDKRVKLDEIEFPEPKITYNEAQEEMLRALAAARRKDPTKGNFLFIAPTSAGKCLGKGTLVLMIDGSTKPVEQIVAGDVLVGPDSLPRVVVSTTSGREQLYRVTPAKGEPYVVNESHILSFRFTSLSGERVSVAGRTYTENDVVNVTVKEWIASSANFKHLAKGWRSPVVWPKRQIPRNLPPYILGLWLGDGNSEHAAITKNDPEIVTAWLAYGKKLGLGHRRVESGKSSESVTWYLTNGHRGRSPHPFMRILDNLNLRHNKHIPDCYLVNSPEIQAELLAGLLDTDGYWEGSGYSFSNAEKCLADGVAFLARSLGLYARVFSKNVTIRPGDVRTYWHTYISGECSKIPCRVARKKGRDLTRAALRTAVDIQPIGEGDYYGFTLDGPDRLFLLGDFTVTHNTIFQASAAAACKQRTLVLCSTNLIKRAWQNDLFTCFGIGKSEVGIIQQSKWRIGHHFTLAMIPTLGKHKDRWDELFQYFGTVVLDEPQLAGARTLVEFFNKCPARYIIGATATDKRADNKNFHVSAAFGVPVTTLEVSEKATKSAMPVKEVEVVDTTYTFEGSGDSEMLDLHALQQDVALNESRNKLVVSKVYRDWKAGRCVLVSVNRLLHAEVLRDALLEAGITDAVVLSGETNTDATYTRKLLDGIFSRSIRCVVASKNAVKLGANLNPLECLHVAAPVLNPQDLEQLIGRIRRTFIGKKLCKVIYYRDSRDSYLAGKFRRVAIPVFRKLKVPGYHNVFCC